MAFVNLSAEKVVIGQSVRGILSNRQIQCWIYLDKILCDPIGSGPPGVNKFSTNVGFFYMLTKHRYIKSTGNDRLNEWKYEIVTVLLCMTLKL